MSAYLRSITWGGWFLAALALLGGCASGPDGKLALPEWKNPFQKKLTSPSTPSQDVAANKAASANKATSANKKDTKVSSEFFDGLMRGRQLEQQGKLTEARQIYQRLIVQYPDRYEPYHRLGVVADREKRYQEAVALYTQAIALNPDPEIFNDLGYSYYLQGQLDKAESALLKAVSMKPANPRFRNNLGMVYGYQGRYEEAIEQFRRGGSEADAYYNMAFILVAQENLEGAKRCLLLAQAADPTHKKAQEALASLEGLGRQHTGLSARELPSNDGRRWELYRESSESREPATSSARPASYETSTPHPENTAPIPTTPQAVSPHKSAPRPDTQALLRQARSMMAQRMTDQQTTIPPPDSQ